MPGLGFNQSHSGLESLNRLLSAISIKRMTTQPPWFVQQCTLANGRQFRKVSFWQPFDTQPHVEDPVQWTICFCLMIGKFLAILLCDWLLRVTACSDLKRENCSLKPRHPLVCNFKRCKTEIKTYETRTAIPCQENHNCKSWDTNRKEQKVSCSAVSFRFLVLKRFRPN